jgi:hypothetical protein
LLFANQADREAINKIREREMAVFNAANVNTLLNLVTNDIVIMLPIAKSTTMEAK